MRRPIGGLGTHQRGMTFIGLLIIGILVALSLLVVAKTVPSVIEYQAIRNAVKKASDQTTVEDIQKSFEAATAIDDISSIGPEDLEITKENGRVVIRFDYDKEIVLVGPVSLLIHYKGEAKG